jgi:hypothetical protein
MNRMRELGICGAWANGEEAELFRLSRALFNARGGLFGFPSKFGDVQDRYDRSSCGSLYKRAKSVQNFA